MTHNGYRRIVDIEQPQPPAAAISYASEKQTGATAQGNSAITGAACSSDSRAVQMSKHGPSGAGHPAPIDAAATSASEESKSVPMVPSPIKGKRGLTSVRLVSFAENMNPMFRNTMEDAHCIVDGLTSDPTCGFFGIFDGHGGRDVAEYVRDHLPRNVEIEVTSGKHSTLADAVSAAYLMTDVKCCEKFQQSAAGSTAVTCLIREIEGKRWLISGNCGDARAVLYDGTGVVRLTRDHKAGDADEKLRVEGAGGFVLRKRVMGILAVSRSFGDFALKKYVPCTPYISSTKLDARGQFVIVACDGVWDVLSDEDAVALVREEAGELAPGGSTVRAMKAAQILVDHAIARGSTDNITAMVVYL